MTPSGERHVPFAERLQLRMWAGGAIVSNVGTWMQGIAQDWVVLTQLTHHNATAVGVVMPLYRHLRVRIDAGRLHFSFDDRD